MKNLNVRKLLELAREVLSIEERGLRATRRALGPELLRAVEIFQSVSGRVIVIGVGKSGLIGRKLAATLTSTGTSAVFMHPSEALHGDLGMVSRQDAVLALSFSGETEELKKLLPFLKRLKIPIVSMTGYRRSRLAKESEVTLEAPVRREACPYNITPTASTTAMLALGDALAMALMKAKGFGKEDFARLHPGGSLGRRLNLLVEDVMRKGPGNPVVKESSKVREALLVMTKTRAGAASIVNAKGRLVGFFTDGDLRRHLHENGSRLLDRPLREVMTKKPMAFSPKATLEEAVQVFKTKNFDNAPVVDSRGAPVGLIDERDLLA